MKQRIPKNKFENGRRTFIILLNTEDMNCSCLCQIFITQVLWLTHNINSCIFLLNGSVVCICFYFK
ncbi:hypothetical protein EL75_4727 [Escherichia coli]|nr:hypothetical protein AC84_5385 [Escherichia coli 1-392-07_S4_C1]KGM64142.1 hypothetical protein EL75_4727 [Escherichia coli]